MSQDPVSHGPEIAHHEASAIGEWTDVMGYDDKRPGLDGSPYDLPGPVKPMSKAGGLLENWRPSERKRMGLLSTRPYEGGPLSCPTDLWSYQQLFIDQSREPARKPSGPAALGIRPFERKG